MNAASQTGMIANDLAKRVRAACLQEIRSLKPGNVGLHGDGHGMIAEQFVKSAHAIAEPIAAADKTVGERILHAVSATQAVVDCNTNLGIVLLAAPLVQATWRCVTLLANTPLRTALHDVLNSMDQHDAALAYEAIRLANPGGLGNVPRHDVREAPTISLLDAMRAAADRDTIAMEYCTDYQRVFAVGVSAYVAAASNGMSDEWATTACYLEWLAQIPDTHVLRKHGAEVASQLCQQAAHFRTEFLRAKKPEGLVAELITWDQSLKQRGINPGTSADLTVASVLAYQLQQWLEQQQVTQCKSDVILAWR